MLDSRIIGRLKNNKFDVTHKINSDRCMVTFEYLDFKEVVIIQIIHTGGAKSVIVNGKIKGSNSKIKNVKASAIFQNILGISAILAALIGSGHESNAGYFNIDISIFFHPVCANKGRVGKFLILLSEHSNGLNRHKKCKITL